MKEWQEEALRWHEHGWDYKQIAQELVETTSEFDDPIEAYQIVRRFIYKYNMRHGDKHVEPKQDEACPDKSTIEYKQDGTVISERLIQIIEARSKDVRYILEAHGFDSDEWDVVSCRNNIWSMNSAEEERVNCQSKITVKPKKQDNTLTFEDIDKYFANKTYNFFKPTSYPMQYDPDGLELEIALPDLHAGLFSWRYETGEDYDLKIAIERLEHAMTDIISKASRIPLKKITLVTLGDILHFDNEEQSTTKGTRQQADGRTAKVHDATIDALVNCIHSLACTAPVEVVYLCGNHDRVTGRMLMKAVEMAFCNDSNVSFDLLPNALKYRMFGKNLVGFTHGDMPVKNMSQWLPVIAQKEMGNCITKEVHAGHFHSQKNKERVVSVVDNAQTFEESGITIRYLPTLCSASGWEHQQGYTKAMKAVMSFLWDDDKGLKEIWISG